MIKLIQKIPDSDVSSYIFVIKKLNPIDNNLQNWISQFPKNYFVDSLKQHFENFKHLENVIIDKDELIDGLEKSLNETKYFMENALKDKDEVIKHHENALKEYVRQIDEIKKSILWKILRKFDKS